MIHVKSKQISTAFILSAVLIMGSITLAFAITTIFTNDTEGEIDGIDDGDDESTPATDTRTLTVANAGTSITGLTVTVDFQKIDGEDCDNPGGGNAFSEEISMLLESPSGTIVDLVFDDDEGGPGETYGGGNAERVQVTFDDSATDLVGSTNGGIPETGTFRPEEALSTFNDEDPTGDWIFTFGDTFFKDILCFFQVDLEITATEGGGNGSCGGPCIHPTIGLDKKGIRLVDDGFSYNGNTVDAVPFHTPFPLISAQIGQTNTVSVTAWDDLGPIGIKLVQFGLGVPLVGSSLNHAEVIIEVWLDNDSKVEDIVITDTNNLIENSSVNASTNIVQCRENSDDQCVKLSMEHMYREAPIYNIMSVEVMDVKRHVQATTFNDGVEVLGESMNPADLMNIIPVTTQNYPQRSGQVELTQIDRSAQLWIDPYGYVWYGDDSKMSLISNIPFVRFQDSESPFSGYNDRDNSNFAMYKEQQIERAQKIFDKLVLYKEIEGDDLTNYVAKTIQFTNTERIDDPELQNNLMIESEKAQKIMEHLLDPLLHLK